MKKIALFLIIVLAIVLRFYKLADIPPSLNWDEVAAGYNAYTIANWGRDEWGKRFPIVFESFRDDKHPVHIYAAAVFVKIFGLSDFITRVPSAVFGVLSVIAIYYLGRRLFDSALAGLFCALFLAVSPYHLQFSRGLWEANFALAFFLGGLACFYVGLEKKNYFIPISFVLFGLSFFSYHPAKIVVPLVALFLTIIYFRKLFENKKILIWTACVVILFVGLIAKDPRILGFARLNQTKFSEEVTQKYSGILGTVANNYKKYFNLSYLFSKGDQNSRVSIKVIGQFYKIDLILLSVGLAALLIGKKWKELIILAAWLALSPVAGAVSSIEPSANRGIFMIGPVILLSGGGAGAIVAILKRRWLQIMATVLILVFLGREVFYYLNYYYTSYARSEAIEWQYGMKQVTEYLEKNSGYQKVYMDNIRQQPYIFFLYYLKVPLPEFLRTVKYEETEAKSYNTVRSFGRYQFGGWDPIESYPGEGILYVVTPSYYTGLRYGGRLEVMRLIKYPNGADAFYIVGGHEK